MDSWKTIGFQTPGEKVFAPHVTYLKHQTSGGIWKPRETKGLTMKLFVCQTVSFGGQILGFSHIPPPHVVSVFGSPGVIRRMGPPTIPDVFQNPPNTLGLGMFGTLKGRTSGGVLGGPNDIFSVGVWMSREVYFVLNSFLFFILIRHTISVFLLFFGVTFTCIELFKQINQNIETIKSDPKPMYTNIKPP